YGPGNVNSVDTDGTSFNIVSASFTGVAIPTPDIMHIGGDLTLHTSNDQIRATVNGTGSSNYDQILVAGNADLGNATFYLFNSPNFTETIGDTFTIMTAANISGTFNGLPDGSIINANSAARYRINYTTTNVTLTVVSGYCTWN